MNSLSVPFWQKEVIEFILRHHGLSLEVVITNESAKKTKASFVFRLLSGLDRLVFPVSSYAFRRVNVSELLKDVPKLALKVRQTKYSDIFSDNDIVRIADYQPDIVLRLGFRILKGKILAVAKFGVWSLHHGDNSINRGGPPAFWEVVKRESVTGVTLQVLSPDLDGGVVIDKAFIRTDSSSFLRNQNTLFWAGVELFCSSLEKLVQNRDSFRTCLLQRINSLNSRGHCGTLDFYSFPLYRNPGNIESFKIMISFWSRRVFEFIREKVRPAVWCLYVNINSRHEDSIGSLKEGSNSICFETSMFRYKKIKSPRNRDWADPFVLSRNGRYYVFFEEKRRISENGHISCLELGNDGVLINGPVPVLIEKHHLSYPFMLKHEGDVFMVPEAANSNELWMYKSVQFPNVWEKYVRLLNGISFFDPTLFFHEGIWYLFGTQRPYDGCSPHQYLHIYFSDSLLDGTWRPHPCNPVSRDVRHARPAGTIFKYDGMIIRPSQIGAPIYGYGICFREITKLTPTEYEEKPIGSLLPKWKNNVEATHTINFVEGITVVDAQEK
jgi:hypothetical protein